MVEPVTADAVASWIAKHEARHDVFADVAHATTRHRDDHGCDAFESASGPLLGVLAGALRARRVLEVGTALGYGAFWLARGAPDGAVVDTIERDPLHAQLARAQFEHYGATNIVLHVGEDLEVLAELARPYDLVFYDAAVPTPAHLAHFERLVAPRGALVTSNLFLGRYAPELPDLPAGARYREALFEPPWTTAFVTGGKALSVRA